VHFPYLKSDILIEQKFLGKLKKTVTFVTPQSDTLPPTIYHKKIQCIFNCKGDDAAHQVGITIVLSIHHQKVEILHHSKLITTYQKLLPPSTIPSFLQTIFGPLLKEGKMFFGY